MTRLRALMLGLAVFFPMLTLIPLGSIWLWQHGLLLYWVGGALLFTAMFYILESRLLPARHKIVSPSSFDNNGYSERQMAALAAVQQMADNVDVSTITSRDDILALAFRAVELVAKELQPEQQHPVWNFTIPEILLLAERVSGRLRPIVIDSLPLGEQLTVGQALRLYEWRSAVGVAERVYDVWRLLRVFNPVAAVTQEARERVTKQIIASVRDDLTKRAVRVFTTEVGLAAVDLYGGRLDARAPSQFAETDLNPNFTEEVASPVKRSRFSTVLREANKVRKTLGSLYGKTKPFKSKTD